MPDKSKETDLTEMNKHNMHDLMQNERSRNKSQGVQELVWSI